MFAEQLEVQALSVGKWHVRGRRSVEYHGSGGRLSWWCFGRCVSPLVLLESSAWGKLNWSIAARKRCRCCQSWFRRNPDFFEWPRAPGRRWVTCAFLPGTDAVGARRPLFIAFDSPQPGRERLVSISSHAFKLPSHIHIVLTFYMHNAMYVLAVAATSLDFWFARPRPLWPLRSVSCRAVHG